MQNRHSTELNSESSLLWDRFCDPHSPSFLVAEIGINHNGSLDIALESIAAAAAAGADGVKFQNYYPEEFLLDESLSITYQSQGKTITESQAALFRRCALNSDQLRKLSDFCNAKNVTFFSTPTSDRGISDLVSVGAPLIKNGSDFLGHLDLIRSMARTNLVTVLSTGMATSAEIDDAVNAYTQAGGSKLVLLQCTSRYPTPPEETNLRAMATLRARYQVPVGFSDHTEGARSAMLATALGARFIEKHFTLDRNLPGPDHWFSSDPCEFRDLVDQVRDAEVRLGRAEKKPTTGEEENRLAFRLSIVARDSIVSGSVITRDMIVFRRPGSGIPPSESERVIGCKALRALGPGEPIAWTDLLPAKDIDNAASGS